LGPVLGRRSLGCWLGRGCGLLLRWLGRGWWRRVAAGAPGPPRPDRVRHAKTPATAAGRLVCRAAAVPGPPALAPAAAQRERSGDGQ